MFSSTGRVDSSKGAKLINRRRFLAGIGAIAGATLLAAQPALAESPDTSVKLSQVGNDWRSQMIVAHGFRSATLFSLRYLREGLEIWEIFPSGYMLVDSANRVVYEYSLRGGSPLRGLPSGDAVFLGVGHYLMQSGDLFINPLTGDRRNAPDVRSMATDARDLLVEMAEIVPAASLGTQSSSVSIQSKKGDPPVADPSQISKVVNYATFIRGCHVYNNTEGTCGWVAGSILMRYWHVVNSSKKIIPPLYLNGSNLHATNNFSEYLRDGRNATSWARNLKDQLVWLGEQRKVKVSPSWALGNIGITNELNANRPVVVFGALPKFGGGTSQHAVVAYGTSKTGGYVTHYGYKDRYDIIVNTGIIGSNTKFRFS